MNTPLQLSPEQQAVVDHRGAHLQVIACAGSGKTESISRRVAALVREGAPPESIVAFTFTERAAGELKERIVARTVDACGEKVRGRLARMFVGTIHAYCFKLLQDHVPKYGNFDVLDEHRHAGLLAREGNRLSIATRLGTTGRWASVQEWKTTVDVIGNELIPRAHLQGDLGALYDDYVATLDRYHYLTFSLVIQKAVEALDDPTVFAAVHGPLRHLIVDEYQDVNPAQEALIRKLGTSPVEVCVVGDDDQAIYQWRGSDVANIQRFTTNFAGAQTHSLLANRRSRRAIVEAAEKFAQTIPQRLEKSMRAERDAAENSVVAWRGQTPEDEAATIAATIVRLHERGYRYRDIGVLFRSVRTSAPALIAALAERGIPYTCGGRTGLFLQPEIELLGRTYVWLAGWKWRPPGYGVEEVEDTQDTLVDDYVHSFGAAVSRKQLLATLNGWKRLVGDTQKPVNLIRDFYSLLNELGIHELDPDDAAVAARLGAFARFSNILADFENVTRRGRWQTDESGEQSFRGGQDRGELYYQRLAGYLLHYARDAYEDFDGEIAPDVDAVDIVTVHQSKGLEWPVVFLPNLVSRRFPSSKAGSAREWQLPFAAFPAEARERYCGGDADERRLFYVALTRAREVVYASCFERQSNRARPSPYLEVLFGEEIPERIELPLPAAPVAVRNDELAPLRVSFTDIASFDECGYRYRLSSSFGFETQLVSELGYGRAIHHVLRAVADATRAQGSLPSHAEVERLIDDEFYLPFANAGNFDNMRRTAGKLVHRYVDCYADDLERIWATERSFELQVREGTLSGRADVILDRHDGIDGALAIVDYKTSKGSDRDDLFAFQLAVYAAAGRAEGLHVQAAYLHHLDESERSSVAVDPPAVARAVDRVEELVSKLRSRHFSPKPASDRCAACEYRRLCRHAPVDPWDEA